MISIKDKFKRRQSRVREKIAQTKSPDRLRLSVFRSNCHMYAQLINMSERATVVSASTIDKEFKGQKTGDVDAARRVGVLLAKRAEEKGITKEIVFDRSGYPYHGRVKALADGAREGGLIF